MSKMCLVCSGALPDGARIDGHTALCAEVVRARAEQELKAARDVVEYVRKEADHAGHCADPTCALCELRVLIGKYDEVVKNVA